MGTRAKRWSDNDRYYGPFTVSKNGTWNPVAVVLSSGDEDEREGCRLRVSMFGWTVIASLPPIIKPYKWKTKATYWSPETIERMGRDWYWQVDERAYGFTCSDGHLSVKYGRVSNDSSTEKRWGWFLPWKAWRHVRHSFYGLDGEAVATLGGRVPYDETRAAEDACPSVVFNFADFDGEELKATTKIEEREWRLGEGYFKWLSLFNAPKISRSLDIRFSGETGKRKGSWKGGTVGHSIKMEPGELHEAAFRRYCVENNMTFLASKDPSHVQA